MIWQHCQSISKIQFNIIMFMQLLFTMAFYMCATMFAISWTVYHSRNEYKNMWKIEKKIIDFVAFVARNGSTGLTFDNATFQSQQIKKKHNSHHRKQRAFIQKLFRIIFKLNKKKIICSPIMGKNEIMELSTIRQKPRGRN